MKNLINKSLFFLLAILFFSLPLVNSHLLNLFWIDFWFYVNWNYEFTKVIFFNILSGIIITLFWIKILLTKEKILVPKYLLFFIFWVVLTTIFSTSFYNSLFWNSEKWHSLIMIFHLIWIFIVLINTKKNTLKKLLIISIFSGLIISLIWIWQLYFPSFDYKNLSNRLVSTSWHPNYISLYFLLIIPFLYPIKNDLKFNKQIQIITLVIIIMWLLLTKSFIAIWLVFSYFYFLIFWKYKYHIFAIIILIWFIWIITFYPEKLSSFLSRFFIWITAIKIIFSDVKILFLWWWAETFSYFFDNYKHEYLYIFEKIWFTADRPHNIILNFFYHFWIFWLMFIFYIYGIIIKNFINNKTAVNTALFLWSIFILFNFPSISVYLLLIILFSTLWIKWKKINYKIITLPLLLLPLFWIYYSTKFYISETYAYNDNYEFAIKNFPYNSYNYYKLWDYNSWLKIEKHISEKYYLTKIYSLENPENDCKELIKYYYSVENYFFCWNLLWKIWKYDSAKKYYKIWLKKLPDLWNDNSSYYNNIVINKFISWNRFFSEKFSNLNQILERVK